MSEIIGIKNITESDLWKSIDDSSDSSIAALKSNLVHICSDASQQMKLAIKYFPQYTLHDDNHLIRMIGLIPQIAGDSMNILNSLEKAILVLGIYFHDIGMVPSEHEYNDYKKDPEYLLFREQWIVNHANYEEIQNQIEKKENVVSDIDLSRKLLCELDQAILTEFIREKHAYFSGEYVKNNYKNDKRLDIFGVNIAHLIAKVCESHGLPIEELTPENGYNYDEQIGSLTVNLHFISILLRLADILDFDKERTPDTLYQSIHFTSSVSIGEWEKHRAVQGWSISKTLLRYTMYFEHPVYENIARKFIDLIDKELLLSHLSCDNYPDKFSGYKIELPQQVDRTRIGPVADSYLYFDLEFSLSRNEVVNLLMGNNLYSSPSLCVRELLQNSADALRMRSAQYKETSCDWQEGKISFEHYLTDDNIEVLKCQDNGIGMDEEIIKNYFTKVGRSYYKSPEFKQKLQLFKKAGIGFNPCSQFGIGFMSCFMLGDRIVVETRKDYGPENGYGSPLIVEINGTGGIISIKKGKENQPIGTTVLVYGRKKTECFNVWSDKIRLTTVLRGYALGIEFPIYAKCSINEINEECEIDTGILPFPSFLERQKLLKIRKYNIDLSLYSSDLSGMIKESFLINHKNNLSICSDEGEWNTGREGSSSPSFSLVNKKEGGVFETVHKHFVTVCLDGVLVAGIPGRPGYPNKVNHFLGHKNSGIYAHASCCVDIRGSIKPEISPARIPVNNGISLINGRSPKWQRIYDFVGYAEGDIWNEVVEDLNSEHAKQDLFWKLSAIYSVDLFKLSFESINNFIFFPFELSSDTEWITPKTLDTLEVVKKGKDWSLKEAKNGMFLKLPQNLDEWIKQGTVEPLTFYYMKHLLVSLSSLEINNNRIFLKINRKVKDERPSNVILEDRFEGYIYCLSYSKEADRYLSIGSYFPSVNLNHPIVKETLNSKYISAKSIIQDFMTSFLMLLPKVICSDANTIDQKFGWKKYIGSKYFSIVWENYDESLKPPYFIRLRNGKEISITEEVFDEWRMLPPQKDNFLDEIVDDSKVY